MGYYKKDGVWWPDEDEIRNDVNEGLQREIKAGNVTAEEVMRLDSFQRERLLDDLCEKAMERERERDREYCKKMAKEYENQMEEERGNK